MIHVPVREFQRQFQVMSLCQHWTCFLCEELIHTSSLPPKTPKPVFNCRLPYGRKVLFSQMLLVTTQEG